MTPINIFICTLGFVYGTENKQDQNKYQNDNKLLISLNLKNKQIERQRFIYMIDNYLTGNENKR